MIITVDMHKLYLPPIFELLLWKLRLSAAFEVDGFPCGVVLSLIAVQ